LAVPLFEGALSEEVLALDWDLIVGRDQREVVAVVINVRPSLWITALRLCHLLLMKIVDASIDHLTLLVWLLSELIVLKHLLFL